MLATVACDSARAVAMPRRSPLTRVSWALFMATSVPVPMAMPTSARASAGASLMPSPAMATVRPSACRRSTRASLSAGNTSPCTSSMPRRRPTAPAVVSPSPVAMMMRRPAACRAASASGVLALMGSETASRPASCPSTARNITLAPSPRNASAVCASGPVFTLDCCISTVLPSAKVRPAIRPRTPMPEAESNCSAASSASPCWRAAATMAAASGCSLPWSRLAARRSTSASRQPGAATVRSKRGRPSVRVPVLSTINVSTRHICSMAAALRNSTPCVAPRPVATMMDIGVARPSAQGQAMIRTATALIRP